MDDIPESIRALALKAFYNAKFMSDSVIAEAVWAERQRCARIAIEQSSDYWEDKGDLRLSISQAILDGKPQET